jgi:NAD(P)-dependent dehydrogenase (short-subunit alcohol dehydrogenase family)
MKTALITGAGQGIGKATAALLARNGYAILLAETDSEAGRETKAELTDAGGAARFLKTDAGNEAAIRKAVKTAVDWKGRLDLVVNNAGIGIGRPVTKLTLAEWNRVLAVNLTAAFLTAKYAAPALKAVRGSIVNIASTRALMSEKDTEAYSASKGGLVALTHALAISLGPDVRVNCISPGWIDVTPWRKKSKRKPAELSKADHAQHPCGRVGEPDDIARMVLFLADPANGFITGQNVVLDGGMTRKMIYT